MNNLAMMRFNQPQTVGNMTSMAQPQRRPIKGLMVRILRKMQNILNRLMGKLTGQNPNQNMSQYGQVPYGNANNGWATYNNGCPNCQYGMGQVGNGVPGMVSSGILYMGGAGLNQAQMMPMQSMPMQSMPMQSMPMQSMPMQSMPMQSMPMQSMPMQSMPMQSMPMQSMVPLNYGTSNVIPMGMGSQNSNPVNNIPVNNIFVNMPSANTVPVFPGYGGNSAPAPLPANSAPANIAPANSAPAVVAPANTAPANSAPVNNVPINNITINNNNGNSTVKVPSRKPVKPTLTGKMWDVNFDYKANGKTKTRSPIILDLNGDGKPNITGKNIKGDGKVSGRKVAFDIDPTQDKWQYKSKHRGKHYEKRVKKGKYKGQGQWKNGVYYFGKKNPKEKTEWLKKNGGDGFLVWDVNKDGKITSSKELFGNFDTNGSKKFNNGYEKLSKYFDKNKDGVVNGSEINGLSVWKDTNANGKTEKGELKPLSSYGIKSLDISKINIHDMSATFAK